MGDFVSTTERIALQPLADHTISLIREWKNRCRDGGNSEHKICSISERRFLPSRLIELTPSACEIRLRLVRSKSMGMYDYDTATYSALSYCWGPGDQAGKLTAANLLSYKKAIPWQSLPKTLKDAATATHLLGMRYVWIDSLCIMQGDTDVDKADKEKEISKMDKVYCHATFTIMARRGDKATDGFLHDRTPPSGTCLLPFQVNNEQHGWVTVTFLSAVEDEDNTALDTRGWITQEYVLSRRLIVFGTWYTEWSCRKERKVHRDGWRHLSHPSEEEDPFHYYAGWDKSGSPIGSAEAQSIEKSHLTDAIMFFSANPEYQHRKPEDHLVVKTWGSLVDAYTRRKLSHKEDRILAISGMAARFASTISESRGYIAGLWECRLPGALLWRRAPKFPPAPPDTSQKPSWSWVSVNTPVISQSPSKCISRLRVLNITYHLSESEAPYGAVDSAELHIEGPAFIIEWRYTRCDDELSHSDASKDISECRWRRDEEDENSVGPKVDITLDARADEKGWKNVVLLAILGPRGAWDSIEGIVLIEVEGTCNPVRYRRLGNFNLNWAYGTGSPLPKTGRWPVGSFHII